MKYIIRLNKTVLLLLVLLQFVLTESLFSQVAQIKGNDPISIIIIAGQSNAINIHADSKDLLPNEIDSTILFYYHTGMPPDRGLSFFSTSNDKWTKLSIQKQDPFLAHREYFFGPEITITEPLKIIYKNLAVIKCAYAGSSLADDWERGAVKGNMLYKIMLEQINNACYLLDSSGFSYSFEGFFWIQGEKDASDNSDSDAYQDNMKDFIEGVRIDLKSPDLPFILSRLPSKQPYAYLQTVRNAQEKITEIVNNTRWIDTDSLALDKDSVHFISSGVKKLGSMLASSFLNLITSNNEFADKGITNFILKQNYPNPFNPLTTINYSLPESGIVNLTVYDLLGQKICTLIDQHQNADEYHISFDSTDLSSGIYLYRLTAGHFSKTLKMCIVR